MQLPVELRQLVYQFCDLRNDRDLTAQHLVTNKRRIGIPLLQVNDQIRTEAFVEVIRQNIVNVSSPGAIDSIQSLAIDHHIRELRILMLAANFRYRLHCNEDYSAIAGLVERCRRLRTLHLDFVWPYGLYCRSEQASCILTAALSLPSLRSIVLKADYKGSDAVAMDEVICPRSVERMLAEARCFVRAAGRTDVRLQSVARDPDQKT